MSLWSPVDLVNGSRNVKNNSLTNGTQKDYEQFLEHLNNKLLSSQAANLSDDEKQLLYNQIIQSQLKNRMLNPSSSDNSDNNYSESSSHQLNRNRNDNQRNSQRNQQQQIRNASSNKSSNQRQQQQLNFNQQQQQQSNMSSNKRSNNFGGLDQSIMEQLINQNANKKLKTNHQQQQQSIPQMNPQLQYLQAQIQMQFAQHNQNQQQQMQLAQQLQLLQQRQLLKNQLAKQAAQQQQQQQQSKKNNNDLSKQFINQLNNQLNSQALAALVGSGGDMPLDLCVNNSTNNKKQDILAITNQIRQSQLLANLNNSSNNNELNPQLNDNEQLIDNLMKQKRGRKPKTSTQSSELSLIQQPTSSSSSISFNQQTPNTSNFDLLNSLNNSTRDSPINQQNSSSSLIDKQPQRKRGRPPSSSASMSTNNLNQQQQQQSQNNQSQNANLMLLVQIAQQNPELMNTPAYKAMFCQLLQSANNQNQNNRQNSNNNVSELLAAQLLTNKIKNQLLLQGASSLNNNRQTSSTATSSSSSNNNCLSTGKVVIEEIKTRDQLDSDESDVELTSKDQITFTKNYDERVLRVPIAYEWTRQTIVKLITKSGVRGDVFYITPCGKKLKNYSEVDKYLMKSNKNNLRKEHFNFSSRVVIGEFIEQQGDKQNDFRTLNENEVIQRIENERRQAIKKTNNSTLNAASSTINNSSNSIINHNSTNNGSIKLLDKLINNTTNLQSSLSANKKSINNSAITIETQQSEKERKEKAVAEAKLREELKLAKEAENKRLIELQKENELKIKKEKELQAEVERERRKQHQILIKIIEKNRRQLDRERKLANFSNERRLQQDRRNLKKRIETEILKEIKKPVEDMILKDLNNLQTLNRIPGLKLSSKAFADLLMVYEFLHNFHECINLDKDRIPTLNNLQSALLNLDENAESEFIEILQHLLTIAIDDPGIPYNPNTLIGQKLKDIAINNLNITEVLKLYFQSYVSQIREDSVLERIEFKLYNILDSGKPLLSLNATIKIEILAFISNELLCNQTIIKKIEDRIDSASNVKRDKWVIENDLRKYKLLKAKRERQAEEERLAEEEKAKAAENGEETTSSTTNNSTLPKDKNKTKDDHDRDDSDSDNDSQVYGNEIDGEDQLTNAEIDKNIEKLTKSVNNQSNKLNKIINSYRVTSFGQDRYRRRYWSLPNAGAVLVESMESCEIEEENLKLLLEEENEEDEEMDEEEEEENNVKMEVDNETAAKTTTAKKEEKLEIKKENKKEDNINENGKDVKKEKDVSKTEEDKEENDDAETKEEEEEEEEKSEMPNYLDLLNSECIQQIINNVYLNYPQNKPTGTEGLLKDVTVLPGLEFLSLNQQQQQQRQVFHLLPRTSCSKNLPNEASDLSLDNSLNNGPATTNENSNNESSTIVNNNNTNSNNNQEEKPITQQQDLSIYKINDVLILPQELDIDANLQSQLIELKKLEYNRPKKIPDEYRYGWWNITDSSQLRQVAESLHERANRERNLKKHILKYFNNLTAKIRQNNVEFDITELDRMVSNCPFGAPIQQSEDEWSEEMALKLDILVLELVENLEDTIASSSMQIRGWKPLAKTEHEKEFILYPLYNTEKPANLDDDYDLEDKITINTANSNNDDSKNDENTDEKVQTTATTITYPKINNPILVARMRLLAAEAGIERRYLKPPLGFKGNTILLTTGNDEYEDNANDDNASSGLIRWREAVRTCKSGTQLALLLQFLESCIAWDKSIMRASCQFCNSGENEAELLLCDICDLGYHLYCFRPKMETIPDGDWFCYECQNKNSMDKVCVICGKKGKLINCNSCPKVFHPNCLEPPVNKPQKGRWFCFACIRKSKKPIKSTPANSKTVKSNSTANNDSKTLDKTEKSNTNNQLSNSKSNSTKESKKKPTKKERAAAAVSNSDNHDQSIDDKNTSTASTKETKKESKKKEPKSETKEKKNSKESKTKDKEKNDNKERSSKKKSNKELGTSILLEPKKADNYNPSPFELLLDDIVQHKDSWPFLKPVDTNEYPLYKNIIKKPMDFEKIKQKNDAGQYTDPEQFLADCRLIFDNCETFNEDESPVVKAGRNLKEFIETRWKKLVD